MQRTLADLITLRKQRELRALQALAAQRLRVVAREQQWRREHAALQRSRDQHAQLTRQVHEDARSAIRSAEQLGSHYACLQVAARRIDACAASCASAVEELDAAMARMQQSRALYARACAGYESAAELHSRGRKAARVQRERFEELAGEELRR